MSSRRTIGIVAIAVLVTAILSTSITSIIFPSSPGAILTTTVTNYRTVTVTLETTETVTNTETIKAETTTTTLIGKPGGILTLAVEKDETSLDPIFAQAGVFTDTILNHVYDTLLAYDYNMRLVPRLAESYRQLDPVTYEFRIRKNVRFHDGTLLTADIVKWNIERIITTPSPRQGQLSMIDKVDVLDDLTLRIKLKFPTSEFLPALTWGTGIVSKVAVEKYGNDYGTLVAVGTGPYKLVEWVKGDHAILEKFDGYWGPKALIERIIIRVIPDASVRALSLERGEIQMTQLEPTDAKRLENNQRIIIGLGEPTRTIMLSINMDPEKQSAKALLDRRVRQAINYAIDRDDLVKAIQEGFAISGIGPIPPALKQYWSETLRKYPEKADLEKAKELLREAGYPNGFKTTLLNFFPWGLPIATVIQAQLAKVGIEVEIINMEFGAGAEQLLVKREYDIALHDWAGTGAPTPYGVVGEFFNSKKVGEWQWNLQNLRDERLDLILNELLIQNDLAAQKGLSDMLQRIVLEEGYGVFLYYPYKIHATTNTVQGYKIHPHPWYGFVIWIPSIEAYVSLS